MGTEVEQKIDEFLKEWPQAEWGPAHIVLADPNWSDEHIKWCIGLLRHILLGEYVSVEDRDSIASMDYWRDHSVQEKGATLNFLNELLKIPESERVNAEYESDLLSKFLVNPKDPQQPTPEPIEPPAVVDPPFNYEEPTIQ